MDAEVHHTNGVTLWKAMYWRHSISNSELIHKLVKQGRLAKIPQHDVFYK